MFGHEHSENKNFKTLDKPAIKKQVNEKLLEQVKS
jgi:hypothetical protein